MERVVEAAPAWLSEGRYRLQREIGAGGMGKVYLVYDQELERDVALKVLLPELAGDPQFSAAFVEEARALGQLEHPNLTPVYDIGLAPDGCLYFTMKYLTGETLASLIERLRNGERDALAAWPFTRRLQLVCDVADALAFAHARGVLHRDIKPANIMVGEFGQVTVMDWGLARRSKRHEAVPNPTRIGRLGEASCLQVACAGTPGYMAPETVDDPESVTERSDLYSLGVVMYELFTLQSPYPGKTGMEALVSCLNNDPIQADLIPNPVPTQGRVPKEVALIIRRLMARHQEERLGSATALIEAVRAYQSGRAPVVCVHTGLKRAVYAFARLVDDHGHLVIVLLTVLLTMPILAFVVWWLLHR